MIARLARIASSKWTLLALFVLWVISLGYMLTHGVEELTTFTSGGWEQKQYVIHRNTWFLFLTLVLAGYIAIRIKQKWLGPYGLFEVVAGLAGGYIALAELPLNDMSAWLSVITAGFVVVRGAE